MTRVIRFGIIGCGLMGRELTSAAARWLHLTDAKARPEIVAVCDTNEGLMDWFSTHLPSVRQKTTDYRELLANPDVDAIYRLTNNTPIYFNWRAPLVLAQDACCPFNSQNTYFRKEVFPLLYLPSTVTFRFTDILRGLVAQPILWAAGYHLGFAGATVLQKRNPHDYLKDFESEIPCYLQAEKVVQIAKEAVSPERSISENMLAVYRALSDKGIVSENELEILSCWLGFVA